MIADTWNSWGFSVKQRGARRRLVVGYWVVVALFLFGFARQALVHGVYASPWMPYVLFMLPAMLGGVRPGGAVKPFRPVGRVASAGTQTIFARPSSFDDGLAGAGSPLDEREVRERDSVHFLAYTVARWSAMGLLGLCIVLSMTRVQWLMWFGPSCLFLLSLLLWSLPQSMILWTEPDVEEAR